MQPCPECRARGAYIGLLGKDVECLNKKCKYYSERWVLSSKASSKPLIEMPSGARTSIYKEQRGVTLYRDTSDQLPLPKSVEDAIVKEARKVRRAHDKLARELADLRTEPTRPFNPGYPPQHAPQRQIGDAYGRPTYSRIGPPSVREPARASERTCISTPRGNVSSGANCVLSVQQWATFRVEAIALFIYPASARPHIMLYEASVGSDPLLLGGTSGGIPAECLEPRKPLPVFRPTVAQISCEMRAQISNDGPESVNVQALFFGVGVY